MGNHAAGRAMGRFAEEMLARRIEGESALSLLDSICEPYRGCDAEFEAPYEKGVTDGDYRYPTWALGKLMVEAFWKEDKYDLSRDEDYERYYDDVIHPFSERYELT